MSKLIVAARTRQILENQANEVFVNLRYILLLSNVVDGVCSAANQNCHA